MTVDRKAWEVVDRFEQALCEYTGAPFCVTTDSCTNALRLCFEFWKRRVNSKHTEPILLPKHTYVGVPVALRATGYSVEFVDDPWIRYGYYNIWPFAVQDSARLLKRGMYQCTSAAMPEFKVCLSFQATKHLPIGRGGAILCEKQETADWLRKARFDGRDMHTSLFDQEEFGWGMHCYLTPDAAARGLWLMGALKDHNDPLPATYPDLSKKRWL